MSQSVTKARYALVGTGARSFMFGEAILDLYKENSSLVALCDINPKRMEYHNAVYAKKFGAAPIPTYLAENFDEMIAKEKTDTVIVTSMDRTHHQYIIRAMELGCDVITEKPMTTDLEKCQAILDAVKRTGRKLRVTFNYLFALAHAREGTAAGGRHR